MNAVLTGFILFSAITVCTYAQLLSVVTYNIQSGSGMDYKYNISRTVAAINAITPNVDILTLQEVDNKTDRHPGDDQLKIISNLTGLKYFVLAPFRPFQHGQYGIGILSRFPIIESKIIRYTKPTEKNVKEEECAVSKPNDYCQGILVVNIQHPTRGPLYVATTHIGLGVEFNETVQLVDHVSHLKPMILTGDFNSVPDSPAMKNFFSHSDVIDTWRECGSGEGYTFNSESPSRRIDYVLTRGMKCSIAKVLDTKASDHRPVQVLFA